VDHLLFDTSAIAKRYLKETGTAWVRSLTKGGLKNLLFLSNITAVEVTSAIVRRQKGGTLSAKSATAALTKFRREFSKKFLIIPATSALIQEAEHLAETHALRAYDAVQLATLLELRQKLQTHQLALLKLISADDELNAAASAEGISVENPNTYP
jgi:predicted nucleic acid-binding protein